jgi:hypothetical protein
LGVPVNEAVVCPKMGKVNICWPELPCFAAACFGVLGHAVLVIFVHAVKSGVVYCAGVFAVACDFGRGHADAFIHRQKISPQKSWGWEFR